MAANAPLTARDIRAAFDENTDKRARDLAASLGISEAALVAAQIGHGATAIAANPDDLMPQIPALGEVLALTRTPSVVHEKVGVYDNFQSGKHASMVLTKDIDLRIFPGHWAFAFAVESEGKTGVRRSIQVFDKAGDAVHKIHLRETSNTDAYAPMVEALRLDEQLDTLPLEPRVPATPAIERADRADVLRREWDRMTDTHQFMLLTRKLKINRLGAYRIAGAPYVRPLALGSVDQLLTTLGETGVPVMVFVGNHGCIQIHSGPVKQIKKMGPWMNVMDPGFNLHLRSDHVAEIYEVRKPTKRGMAISVEAFDADGAIIMQIFGMRVNGEDHVAAFEALLPDLEDLSTTQNSEEVA
ncbi:MAG: hemin-degrading factor [Maritimibacter sp.]